MKIDVGQFLNCDGGVGILANRPAGDGKHGKVSMVKQPISAGADGEGLELGTVQEHRERAQDMVHRMSETQLEAHNAAEAELLATRRERNTDPVFFGYVFADLSSRIIAME